ncbi:MAG TPA: SDR family oxidoreductase, partial [Spirochaetia bacterium]|nr:SDR family oxidoreductase [Spirochaetia bacterium]
MDLGLKGKTALVTGGGTGIGAGICEALAQEGVNVAVNWIVGKDEVTAFASELSRKSGTDCRPFYADVSKAEDLDAMVKEVVAAYGHIDILVNNAGIWPTENILDMPDGNWKKVIDINLNGPFMLCKRVARHMIDSGIKGSIVNLSSKSGLTYNTAGHAHY